VVTIAVMTTARYAADAFAPFNGSWRSQAGEQVTMLKGEFGDAGKLTVR